MARTVFIDGGAGTTGLEIIARLEAHPELTPVVLEDDRRKDAEARRAAFNEADFAVLCLPDAAAREAVELIDPESKVRVVDASSAHRCASGWIYGFPELVGKRVVAGAERVSNPGCYASGFLALIAPLVRSRLLPAEWPYTVHAVSGYSGGGKGLIERYEDDPDLAYRAYALRLGHKHLPEMQQKAGLKHPPVFCPAVVPTHRGMIVEVPLALEAMPTAASPAQMRDELEAYYAESRLVTLRREAPEELLLLRSAQGSDRMDLYVFAEEKGGQARLVAVLDNLGKGASGAAVQSLNLMAECEETAGLRV